MKTRTKLFRIFGILLGALFVLACAVGFAACGDSDDDNDENKGNPTVGEDEGDGNGDGGSQGGDSGNQGEHTHSYTSAVTKEATCGDVGTTTYTCSCGDTYTEDIPATGAHEVDVAGWTVSTPASCGEAGSRTNTCIVCGHTVTEAIPATSEHAVAVDENGEETWTATKEATCGVDGEQTGTCTNCGATVTEVIPATGEHTYGELTADSETGKNTQTCSVCGDVQTVDVSAENSDSGNTVAVLRAEAENAVIDVDESKMNYWLMNEVYQGNYISTMGFLFDIQDDATASGGQSVGYLAHGNPTLTFTINSSAAVSNAKITVHGASCDIDDDAVSSVFGLMSAGVSEYKGEDHDILLVNPKYNAITGALTSGKVTLSGSYQGSNSVFGSGDSLAYNTWGNLTGTVDLVSGDNTFVLTHDGSGVNFDYIEIEAPETNSGEVALSFVETDNSELVTYDPNWTANDAVTLEAENAGCFNATDSATFMETVEYVATGDGAVANFTKGDKIVFQLLASAAITDADITVNMTSSGTLAASDVTMTLNGDADNPLTTKLSRGTIQTTTDLSAGVNYIELTCASDDTLEVDNIVVDWDYVDADADYGQDHTTTKTAGRGNYVVTTVEEVVTGGTTWNIANATATDDGYSIRMEAEEAGLYNAVGVTGSTNVLGTEETTLDDDSVITNVKNFNTVGDMIVFQVYASEAMTDVTIEITAANAAFTFSTATFADNDKILTVNGGKPIALSGTLSNSVSALYTNYGTLTGTISLQQGVNYIVISAATTATTGYLNVDKIELIWGVTAVDD